MINESGHFTEAGSALGMDDLRDARGCAAADFDHDGDIDFIVNNYRAKAAYFVNQVGQARPSVAVRAPIGTELRIAAQADASIKNQGIKPQVKYVGAGHGYAGQNSTELLFAAAAPVRIEARFPGGQTATYGPVAPGERLTVKPYPMAGVTEAPVTGASSVETQGGFWSRAPRWVWFVGGLILLILVFLGLVFRGRVSRGGRGSTRR